MISLALCTQRLWYVHYVAVLPWGACASPRGRSCRAGFCTGAWKRGAQWCPWIGTQMPPASTPGTPPPPNLLTHRYIKYPTTAIPAHTPVHQVPHHRHTCSHTGTPGTQPPPYLITHQCIRYPATAIPAHTQVHQVPNHRNICSHTSTSGTSPPELWLAPLQVAHATSAATFSVALGLAPLLFKIDSAACILTTFKRCANR